MGEPVLSVDGLRVRYGPIEAVNDLTFELSDGDVLTLLGSNGGGKSSTLRAISGLVDFDGTVTFDGSPIAGRSPESLARRGLVHVPEGRRIFATLSVEENLQIAQTAAKGRPALFEIEDVYELFEMLHPLRERGGWALSGGEQQMLAIGRGLLGAPRVLLLDEPSLGLAPSIVDTVFSALSEIADRVPLLLVEQNTTVALEVCTSAIVLAQGVEVLSGTPDQLADRSALLNSYLGTGDIN